MKYNKEELVELLRDDKNYYGDIGNKILSNSNIDVLLKKPNRFKKSNYTNSANVSWWIFSHRYFRARQA